MSCYDPADAATYKALRRICIVAEQATGEATGFFTRAKAARQRPGYDATDYDGAR